MSRAFHQMLSQVFTRIWMYLTLDSILLKVNFRDFSKLKRGDNSNIYQCFFVEKYTKIGFRIINWLIVKENYNPILTSPQTIFGRGIVLLVWVCFSVCDQDNSKSAQLISMKWGRKLCYHKRKVKFEFDKYCFDMAQTPPIILKS